MDNIVGASEEAIAKAEVLAQRALEDDWMNLVADDKGGSDYEEWLLAHRLRWEETGHFDVYYGNELDEIVREDFRRQGGEVDAEDLSHTGYFDIRGEVYDRFWSIWEGAKHARDFWRRHYGDPELRLVK